MSELSRPEGLEQEPQELDVAAERTRLVDKLKRAHSDEAEIERLRTLLADIKAWDVAQYMTIPHDLRARMQKEIGDGK